MTTQSILETIRENKIGIGCKIVKSVSNKILIDYPLHKMNQYGDDLSQVKKLIGFSATGCTRVVGYAKNNRGCINIDTF
jgi:hypothetical protein